MKDIDLYAIDRNYSPGVRTAGLKGTVLESKGDFELVDPLEHFAGKQYIARRAVTVVFSILNRLVTALESFGDPGFETEGFRGFFETGGIKLFAIMCHGCPGGVDINGLRRNYEYLAASTVAPYSEDLQKAASMWPANGGPWNDETLARDLRRLGNFLGTDSAVRFDGCNIGSGDPGTDFLVTLSTVWPGIRVIAFSDYAIGAPSKKSSEPRLWGVADSNDQYPEHPSEFEMKVKSFWNAPRSEASPNAKIAQNGCIIKWPASEILLGHPPDHVWGLS